RCKIIAKIAREFCTRFLLTSKVLRLNWRTIAIQRKAMGRNKNLYKADGGLRGGGGGVSPGFSITEVDQLLTEAEVAELLGWSKKTLQRRRWLGLPPEFVKLDGRSVRYRVIVIKALIEAGIRTSTTEAA